MLLLHYFLELCHIIERYLLLNAISNRHVYEVSYVAMCWDPAPVNGDVLLFSCLLLMIFSIFDFPPLGIPFSLLFVGCAIMTSWLSGALPTRSFTL